MKPEIADVAACRSGAPAHPDILRRSRLNEPRLRVFDIGASQMKHLRVESANSVSEKAEGSCGFNPVPIHMIYDRWTTEFIWASRA
jgi:hypothetical protein